MEEMKQKDDIKHIYIDEYKINIYDIEYIKRIKGLYGFVYVTTNLINGKMYVGQKRIDKNKSWIKYLGSGKILKQAIDKYGEENFHREIIDIAFTKKELNYWEKYYTVIFNSVNSDNWYNLVYGGNANSISLSGKDSGSARAVICLTTNEIFDTGKEACDKYGLSSGALSNACKGKKQYSCGKLNGEKLVWMYLDEYSEDEAVKRLFLANTRYDNTGENNPMYGKKGVLSPFYGKPLEKMKGSKNPSARKIICLTTGEVFETATEGANKYNTGLSHIISCCRGKLESSGKLEDGTKLRWAYYEDVNIETKNEGDKAS